MNIKISKDKLKETLRKKTCSTPITIYLANELFNDPSHPITSIDLEDFRLSSIFNYIQLDDPNNNRESTG